MRKFFIVVALAVVSTQASAQAPHFVKPTGNLLQDIRASNETPPPTATPDLVSKIQQVALADLKAASADAKATGDLVSAPCYDAWITLIEAQEKAKGDALPDPAIITHFQRNRDLVNALRPGSPLKTACAPLAEELKQDVMTLLSKVAGGLLTVPAMLAPFGL